MKDIVIKIIFLYKIKDEGYSYKIKDEVYSYKNKGWSIEYNNNKYLKIYYFVIT